MELAAPGCATNAGCLIRCAALGSDGSTRAALATPIESATSYKMKCTVASAVWDYYSNDGTSDSAAPGDDIAARKTALGYALFFVNF